MIPSDLEKLIDAALIDGTITSEEKQVLQRKAHTFGIDEHELELLLITKLQQYEKNNKILKIKNLILNMLKTIWNWFSKLKLWKQVLLILFLLGTIQTLTMSEEEKIILAKESKKIEAENLERKNEINSNKQEIELAKSLETSKCQDIDGCISIYDFERARLFLDKEIPLFASEEDKNKQKSQNMRKLVKAESIFWLNKSKENTKQAIAFEEKAKSVISEYQCSETYSTSGKMDINKDYNACSEFINDLLDVFVQHYLSQKQSNKAKALLTFYKPIAVQDKSVKTGLSDYLGSAEDAIYSFELRDVRKNQAEKIIENSK